nr:tyrosine--tRNA ligase [Streptomyces sp. SID7803]
RRAHPGPGVRRQHSAARRLAKQNALRLVVETAEGQKTVTLSEDDVTCPLHEAVKTALATAGSTSAADTVYLKAGRKVAKIEGV